VAVVVACHQSQCRQNFNAPLVNTAAMALRYLPEVQQHLAPPFPVWKQCGGIHTEKKDRKSQFLFTAQQLLRKTKRRRTECGHLEVTTFLLVSLIFHFNNIPRYFFCKLWDF
jgi:hypothetical protein